MEANISWILFLVTISCSLVQSHPDTIFFPRDEEDSSGRFNRNACRNDYFSCKSGQCILMTSVCDGPTDCSDGSDETEALCTRLDIRCPAYAFRCSYGGCIDGDKKCDGEPDCADGSDESTTICTGNAISCRAGEFWCSSGECINQNLLCNGVSDCSDNSDESSAKCKSIRCPPLSFRCAYGACIDGSKRCDGKADCIDGSDEASSSCQHTTRTTCVLPENLPHRIYSVTGCRSSDNPICTAPPGTAITENIQLVFSCDDGYQLDGHDFSYCVNNKWLPQPPNCKPGVCPNLKSESVDLTCYENNKLIDCNDPMMVGTQVRLRCKVSHQLVTEPNYNVVTCLQNGNWDNPLFSCVPECGTPISKGSEFISNGQQADEGELPWHVAVYEKKNDYHEQICGGSIIKPNLIVSAAHCFYRDSSVASADNFIIAAGKYHRNYSWPDVNNQFMKVNKIYIPDDYRGRERQFVQDIAVVKLEHEIKFQWNIRPVCIDWEKSKTQQQLQTNSQGKIAGWGVTSQHGSESNVLITAQLPFVLFSDCWARVPEKFRPWITNDKFCAGHTNGTTVCPGDSGGGLVFITDGRYYLQGIVSVGPTDITSRCAVNHYAAFTKVTEYLDWILRIQNNQI